MRGGIVFNSYFWEVKRFPKLNLPPCSLRVSKDPRSGALRIWDKTRSIWLVLTPEEWVRRHVVEYLTNGAGVPEKFISHEYSVTVSGMAQRADIVVTGRDGSPLLLVECKAPGIGIDKSVYAQAVRYNHIVGAKFILLTNGLTHCVLCNDSKGNYLRESALPDLGTYFR
ncbi:MAG: type I restriction enzyme HsdR N-terminal domain-containing protein [Rikenellaceae bacterium]|nr:type I restriction enzyme HsdR N-terminal domain-containing protein [Rikenellaceae bacterium]